MTTVTLQQVHRELHGLRKEVRQLRLLMQDAVNEDDLRVADDVIAEVAASRRRKRTEFVSNEDLIKKYDVQ
ncbi:hypothetical protein HYS50_00515 [Candidatus Woesearchaeota archaeon]|nr:hypothetical protein [Candidatus Woesearchaeota archaeon]